MFAGLLLLITSKSCRRVGDFVIAMVLEAIWEILENTNAVIDRYREATASLGYQRRHGNEFDGRHGLLWCGPA